MDTGWTYLVWWPLTLVMVAGYVLAWHWQRRQRLLRPADFSSPLHWTERDQRVEWLRYLLFGHGGIAYLTYEMLREAEQTASSGW